MQLILYYLIPFNRWKIILLATFFNLTWEFSTRGLQGLFKPFFLPIILFGFYFTFFTMLEDLIVRFKLKNYQVMFVAFLYGLFPLAFGSRDLFKNPHFLGVNWLNLFWIGFLWWGIMQTVFALYFANRIVRRDWDHPRMSKAGWLLALGYNAVVFLSFELSKPHISPVSVVGYIFFGTIVFFTSMFLWQDIKKNKKRKSWKFRPSRMLDFLSFGSFTLFLALGTFFTSKRGLAPIASSYFNPAAIKIVNTWTLFYSIVFILYRLRSRKEITI